MVSESMLKAAESGDTEAQYKVGIEYCLGSPGTHVDYKKAAEWFQKAVDNGFLPAKRELGILYLRGEGVKADGEKAFSLLAPAAEAMDPNAMYHLALMYENGIGTKKDLYKAIKLLAHVANEGYQGADMDADRVYSIIVREREKYLKARPLLNLEVSDNDVMAACCKQMLDDMLDESVIVLDTFEGSKLVMWGDDDNEIPIKECPYCGKPVKKVPCDKKY